MATMSPANLAAGSTVAALVIAEAAAARAAESANAAAITAEAVTARAAESANAAAVTAEAVTARAAEAAKATSAALTAEAATARAAESANTTAITTEAAAARAAEATKATPASVATLIAAQATADNATFGRVIRGEYVSQALTDGSDQTSTINTELAAIYAAGGGTYYLPVGTVRINSQITIPHDASTIWKQPSIRIVGGGHRQADVQVGLAAATGGTVLDLRYSGADAKILTLGLGLLQVEQVTFADDGTSTTPFILTTNTTLKMRDCTFTGNPSKSGVTCDQDAIILGGGQHAWSQGNLVTSSFAGYGSIFDGLRFSRIQRGFYGKSSCNAVVFDNNTWDSTCGGLTAFELDGTGDQARANTGTGNLIEVPFYQYGMTFTSSGWNAFFGTSFWDATGVTVYSIRLVGSSSGGNEFHGTYSGSVENASSVAYTVTGNSRQQGNQKVDSSAISPLAAPAAPSTYYVINAQRSSVDTTPNGNIFRVSYLGAARLEAVTGATPSLILLSPSAGQIAYDHTSIVRDTGNLDLYAGSGGNDAVRFRRGVFVIKTYTTAARPSASAIGPGATYYDTTVSKPVFSDGTIWRDAAGTAV